MTIRLVSTMRRLITGPVSDQLQWAHSNTMGLSRIFNAEIASCHLPRSYSAV